METTSKIGQSGRAVRQTLRPIRTSRKEREVRTTANDRPAFLGQRFAPLLASEHPQITDSKAIETEFKVSMANLCRLYGWDDFQFPNLAYPVNLSVAMQYAFRRLGSTDGNVELKFTQKDGEPASLSTHKTFCAESCLFYIPIETMYQMVLDENRNEKGNLLLSIFTYLYRIVEIPHFCDDYSYLGSIYAMIEDWWVNDEGYSEDKEETEFIIAHFGKLDDCGVNSLLMLQDKGNLELFGKRHKDFRATTKAERELKRLAGKFLRLYRQYPNRSIFDNIQAPKDIDEYDSYVRFEQLVHFYWSNNEPIHDELMDCINAELNECGAMEVAVSVQNFDEPQQDISCNLVFEETLFDLLHQLIDNIKDLGHE